MDLPYLLFRAFFCDLLSFLVHCCVCIWSLHCLGCKIFCTRSRLSSSTFLRDFQNHGFPRQAQQNDIQSLYSLLLGSTLESNSYSLGFLGDSRDFVSHIRCVARQHFMRLLSPLKLLVKRVLEMFSSKRIRVLILKSCSQSSSGPTATLWIELGQSPSSAT